METFKSGVNTTVYMEKGVPIQLRMPKQTVGEIDRWVSSGRFKNRSDAIRFAVQWFDEREKTMRFFEELERRSAEARQHPEKWVRLEEL